MKDQLALIVAGERNPALAEDLKTRVRERVSRRLYSEQTVSDVASLDMMPIKGKLDISPRELEKLRRMCQVWDIELRVSDIRSHRKFVGPLIVFGKKLLFRLLRVLLKDVLHQQREFNASVIAFCGASLDVKHK